MQTWSMKQNKLWISFFINNTAMKQKGNSEVSSSIALAITRWVPSLVCFLQLEPGLHHDSLLTIVFCNCSCSTGWARQVRGVYTLSLLWSLPFDLSPSEQLQGRYLTPGVLSPGKSFPPCPLPLKHVSHYVNKEECKVIV